MQQLVVRGFGSAAGGAGAAQAALLSKHRWLAALAACLAGTAAVGVAVQSGNPGGLAAAECKGSEQGPLSELHAATSVSSGANGKTRVVVLGSGWGAVAFLKSLDPSTFGDQGRYDLTLVSPANFFTYTPLLPSVVAGTVEERSIVEPVRRLLKGQGNYYQAECIGIDPRRRVLKCAVDNCQACQASHGVGKDDKGRDTFEVPYDILLLGVGSVNNTFHIAGVEENCFFLKTIGDAHRLRIHLNKSIEHAGLPNLSKAERCRHLNFVVVGGGPTGVELAAEMLDLVQQDVEVLMPQLKGDIKITGDMKIAVIDTMDHLLGACIL
ncbi:hypothetical protein N2152v2_006637 [Parachlorella kessleri]